MRKYIFGIILIFALFEYLFNEDSSVDRNDDERNVKKLEEIVFHPQPENGFSPFLLSK